MNIHMTPKDLEMILLWTEITTRLEVLRFEIKKTCKRKEEA